MTPPQAVANAGNQDPQAMADAAPQRKPEPVAADGNEVEDPISDLRNNVRSQIADAKRFWHTRKAVFEAAKSATVTPFRVDKKYMNPWAFNLLQSGFAASIAAVVGKFVPKTEATSTPMQFHGHDIWLPSLVTGTFLPFATFILAKGASYGSLRRSDFTQEKERTAYRAFLYLDGAYGLYPQILLACSVNLLPFIVRQFFADSSAPDSAYGTSGIFLSAVLMISFIWLQYLYFRFIPRRLFVLNGYSPSTKPMLVANLRNRALNRGPWVKYRNFVSYAAAIALTLATLAGALGN